MNNFSCQVFSLFIVVLVVYSAAHSSLGHFHYYCYGNVIGRVSLSQINNNETKSLEKILYKMTTAQHSHVIPTIISIDKMVLYYSQDGIKPVKLFYSNNHMCFDTPVQLGHLFTLRYTLQPFAPAMTTPTSGQLIITTDTHGKYHSYSHTYQYDNLTSFWNPSKLFSFDVHKQCLDMKCTRQSDWSPVSVATFNVWNINTTKNESAYKRLQRLSKILGKSSLDIIGLQEVRTVVGKKRTLSQVHVIRKALPNYQFVYQPAMLMNYNPREEEGVGLLSRFPIIYSHSILLPWNRTDPSDFHQRVCLHCRVAIPGASSLDIFVSHFSLSEQAQFRSIKAIVNYIKDTNIHGPIVLMGDLNSEPHSPAMRYLQSHLSTPLFHDAWSMASTSNYGNNNGNHNNDHHSNNNYDNGNHGNGNTFCTLDKDLTKRIDYIFVQESSKLCISSSYLIGSKTGRPPVSDHLGVVINMKINNK